MIVEQTAYALTAADILAAAIGLARARLRAAVPVMLDLWTAAGLLRLTADRSWTALATAATLVAIRRLVVRTVLAPRP